MAGKNPKERRGSSHEWPDFRGKTSASTRASSLAERTLRGRNVYTNLSLRAISLSVILSTIQGEGHTSPGITHGNFGHYAISVHCFIESLSRRRSVREVTIGSKEGNISHCVLFPESQTTVESPPRAPHRARNFPMINRYSFFEMRPGQYSSAMFSVFPIRRFVFSSTESFLAETDGICARRRKGE